MIYHDTRGSLAVSFHRVRFFIVKLASEGGLYAVCKSGIFLFVFGLAEKLCPAGKRTHRSMVISCIRYGDGTFEGAHIYA